MHHLYAVRNEKAKLLEVKPNRHSLVSGSGCDRLEVGADLLVSRPNVRAKLIPQGLQFGVEIAVRIAQLLQFLSKRLAIRLDRLVARAPIFAKLLLILLQLREVGLDRRIVGERRASKTGQAP